MKKKLILSVVLLLVIGLAVGVYLYHIPKIHVYACVDDQKGQKVTELWATKSSSQMDRIRTLTDMQKKESSGDQAKDVSPDYFVVFAPTNRIGGSLTYRVWTNGDLLEVQPENEGDEIYTSAVTVSEFLTAIGK